MKAMGQPDFPFSLDDIGSPSTEASNFGRRFFTNICSARGRSWPMKLLKRMRERFLFHISFSFVIFLDLLIIHINFPIGA
jgi:hypothetical protein